MWSYLFIASLVMLAAGFAGMRLIPKQHRGLRQFASGLMAIGIISLICYSVMLLIYGYILAKVSGLVP